MKYWIGFVAALIIAACTWALKSFAASHSILVDIIYPYVSRMSMAWLTNRNAKTGLCVWQILVVIVALLIIAAVIYYIWRKKNPIRWISWTLAAICAVNLVSTGLFGLNRYSGPLADDIRLELAEYAPVDLQNALVYYQQQANDLAAKLPRDKDGNVIADFDSVNNKAGAGFKILTEDHFYSVFAGNTSPVKELGWSFVYNITGETNQFFPITGETAVNTNTPSVGLPYAVCRAMAKRICISNDPDSAMAAILACINNPDPLFQYSGYFMAYRYCYQALESMPGGASGYRSQECTQLKHDFDLYNDSFARRADNPSGTIYMSSGNMKTVHVADLLASWHLQMVVAPLNEKEENKFDPLDEDMVDLTGLPNAPTKPAEGQ